MRDGFEAWARREVVRLRAEADLLERLLARYDVSATTEPSGHVVMPGARRNTPLMLAIAAAGRDGLSVAALVAVARDIGLVTTRAAVRSFVWNQVRAGRLVVTAAGDYAVPEGATRVIPSCRPATDDDGASAPASPRPDPKAPKHHAPSPVTPPPRDVG